MEVDVSILKIKELQFTKDADAKIDYFFRNTEFQRMDKMNIIHEFEWLLSHIIEEKSKGRRYFLVSYLMDSGMTGNAFIDTDGMFNYDIVFNELNKKCNGFLRIITNYQEMSKEDYLVCSKKNNQRG